MLTDGMGVATACRLLYSYLKPESVRVHPEATVRPWATCQVVGDALSFASALGYMYVQAEVLLYAFTKSILTDGGRRSISEGTSLGEGHW